MYVCPLTSIKIHTECPVKTCQWHSKSAHTGCGYGILSVDSSTREIQEFKSITKEHIDDSMRKIQCVMLLDRYYQKCFLSKETNPVPDTVRVNCINSPLFNTALFPALNLETAQEMCIIENFDEFMQDAVDEDFKRRYKISHMELMFLSQQQMVYLLNFRLN